MTEVPDNVCADALRKESFNGTGDKEKLNFNSHNMYVARNHIPFTTYPTPMVHC